MTKLKELLKSHERLAVDRLKMIADNVAAKATEDRILADGKIDETEVSALSNARTLRELILRRLPDTEALLKKLDSQIKTELAAMAAKWDKSVATALEAKRAEIVAALRPFYEGEVSRCKELVQKLHCPAIEEIRRAFATIWTTGDDPGLDFHAKNARHFVEHAARAAKQFGLPLPE